MDTKISVYSNNKRQKIEERKNDVVPAPPFCFNNYIKDDAMVLVFSFLHCRDVGKALSTCKEWKRIYDLDCIQTKQFQHEVRWAKYANGHLIPEPIQHRHIERLDLMGGNDVLILDDGRLLTCRRDQENHDQEHHRKCRLDVYCHKKGWRFARHKTSLELPNLISLCIPSRKEYLVIHQLIPSELQFWKIGDDSTLKKISFVKIEHVCLIRDTVISPENKVYYRMDKSIKVWNPMIKEESSEVTDFVNNLQNARCSSICFCKDLVVFGDNNLIQIWSVARHEHLRSVTTPGEIVNELDVQNMHGKDRLCVHSYDEDTYKNLFSIFSIEDGSILCRIDAEKFGVNTLFRNDLLLSGCPGRENVIKYGSQTVKVMERLVLIYLKTYQHLLKARVTLRGSNFYLTENSLQLNIMKVISVALFYAMYMSGIN